MTSPNPIIPLFSTERQREAIVSQYQKSIEALSEVGRLLLEAQKHLDKSFDSFVVDLPFSRPSAYNYMKLYQHVQTCLSVRHANVQISAWYHVPIGDTATIDAIIEKSKQGKRVTSDDVKTLLSSVRFDNARQQSAWQNAAQASPAFVVESIARGYVTSQNGEDIPLEQVDATLIEIAANQDAYEAIQRQAERVKANTKPQAKLTIQVTGAILNALSEALPKGAMLPELGQNLTLLWTKGE
jgi:hypothetical protein